MRNLSCQFHLVEGRFYKYCHRKDEIMQAWNETCFLTRLPILEDERVKLILIAPKRETHTNKSCADGFYGPVSLPLTGIYDGHGNVKSLEKDPCAEASWRELNLIEKGYKDPLETLELREIINAAVDGGLHVMTSEFGKRLSWRQAVLVMAKASYWEYLENMDVEDDVSLLARLTRCGRRFLSPLRDQLKLLSMSPDKEDQNSVNKMLAVYEAMNEMCLFFLPISGIENKNSLEEDWQEEWMESIYNDFLNLRKARGYK